MHTTRVRLYLSLKNNMTRIHNLGTLKGLQALKAELEVTIKTSFKRKFKEPYHIFKKAMEIEKIKRSN